MGIIDKIDIIFNSERYNSADYAKFAAEHDLSCSKLLMMMQRSPELLYTIAMCFEKGITFIPVDPVYPMERIQYIIDSTAFDGVMTDVDIKLDLRKQKQLEKDDIAYILFTSGSTGRPNGVEITREALFNFIEGISEKIDFSPGKRIACLTTVSFDIFFLESIMALYKGLTIVLANEDEQRNPKLMAKLIRDNAVEMVQMTPSRMQLLLNYDKELSCLKSVKEIMIGGEPFPLSLLKTLQERTTAKIYNMYGPTETTIWSAISDLTNKDHIDIGGPIKNTEIYITDENSYILPDGQTGEICIAGKGLAKGYVGKDHLTAEKFIYLPQKPGIRVYRTGDLGKYLPDGSIEYLGRTDNQVKIRGYRIELEEIEMYLNNFEGIQQSVVIAAEGNETEKVLKAFYTSDMDIDPKDIAGYLALKLPSYMIPTVFKRVRDFIQTVNGKIDRKRVLECIENKDLINRTQKKDTIKLTDISQKVMEIVAPYAKASDNITLDSNIAAIGIDSIVFIKIVVLLESEFDFEFDEEKLVISNFSTIRTLTEYVESKC